ncbi:MAG: hypothetical protein KBD63_00610 [Bacteriovoracaceae bacterium]|nr:hypothetical protein [Bacteriovoracaceae bacterium]
MSKLYAKPLAPVGFSEEDFEEFERKLRLETSAFISKLKKESLNHGFFSTQIEVGTFFVDQKKNPLMLTAKMLQEINETTSVMQQGSFSFPLKTTKNKLDSMLLSNLRSELENRFFAYQKVAESYGAHMLMVGSLPFVPTEKLNDENGASSSFLALLNQGLKSKRRGHPIELNIHGVEHLKLQQDNLQLLSGTGDMHITFEFSQADLLKFYNASQMILGPVMAIASNSPFFLGKNLWSESRIALQEQCYAIPTAQGRAFFGSSYLKESFIHYFLENEQAYQPLVPVCYNEDMYRFKHLSLHNETIFRWNRMIINQEDKGDSQFLKMQMRALPAGPTFVDMTANFALLLGLMSEISSWETDPEKYLFYGEASENFYQAARHGLDSSFIWNQGKKLSVTELFFSYLLPMAKKGLSRLGIEAEESKYYLEDVIAGRVLMKQNGASWQKSFIEKHGKQFDKMLEVYLSFQQQNIPVHKWNF